MQWLKNLFAKIKLFLGLGTVKVKLEVPSTFSEKDKTIKGAVHILGKSAQKVNKITIELVEDYSKKSKSGEMKRKKYELGTVELTKAFEIKEGEEKKFEFELAFDLIKSYNDQMKEKGGVVGALGKVGSFLDNEHSEYTLKATADVEAAKLDPMDVVHLQLAKD